ncbi:ABC transporter substrate-binding protein [Dongshaea marina]|uniref:ABC transporter substrate-binding protein n=1 Tax=Dongshaea marina TaxID=2047966 RepID=UPI00131EEF20|nr:ABC transporter substrate binding protein [Dongshaea marina]
MQLTPLDLKMYWILSCFFAAFIALPGISSEGEVTREKSMLIIDSQQGEPYQTVRESMLKELARVGYKQGVNLKLRYYSLGNSEERARSIWSRREQDIRYDVIYLAGTIAARAFKDLALNSEQPFVFVAVTDPIGVGVIEQFDAPPKYNFTGVSYPVKVEERLRFIQRVMPKARTIGLIYADMPQSHSYNRWLLTALNKPEFKELRLLSQKVPFVKTDTGHKRMARLARQYVIEMDEQVDLFISPNDQMGVQAPFAEIVNQYATKPLLGLGRKDVMDGWGASFSIYPDLVAVGKQSAWMLREIFEGKPFKEIYPRWPPVGVAFDLGKLHSFGVEPPFAELHRAGDNLIP